MNSIVTILILLFSVIVFAGEATDVKAEHIYSHKHLKMCGHKAERHGNHVDYEESVNGVIHHHRHHGDHYDECTGPEVQASKVH
jgi:hypothetical protein